MNIPCFASECSKSGVELIGDIIFKIEGKEVQKFNQFPKNWNVNSDNFNSLYLKSKKNISEIEIKLNSKGKDLKSKVYSLVKFEGKKDMYRIKDVLFRKDILSSYSLLPLEMKIIVKNLKEIQCEDKFVMEVIK